MSEFHVVVVKLENKIGRHPNADTLEITQVCGYPVIFKENQYVQGDKVVYVPVDALVPIDKPMFSWLDEGIVGRTHARIKAKKLRGINSVGCLIPLSCTCDAAGRGVKSCDEDCLTNHKVGDNVQDLLGILKYEPAISSLLDGQSERDPGSIPVFTDMESIRKHPDVLKEGDEVVITEKIHGSNARFCFHEDKMWAGSHRQFRKEDNTNMYWAAVRKYKLDEWCKANPSMILYGEVYGHQKGFTYGIPQGKADVGFAAFDIYDIKAGRYINYEDFMFLTRGCPRDIPWIPVAPFLYDGLWKPELMELRFGKSTLHEGTIREGFIVKSIPERYEHSVGRVSLKCVSEDYWVARGNKE